VALWFGAHALVAPGTHEEGVQAIVASEALAFGRRLGAIAAARREGRVPRAGADEVDVPPAAAFGIVFEGALGELGVQADAGAVRAAKDAVARHFLEARALGDGVEGQYRRAEASLALFRHLRSVAGTDVADAYYDVFRPGLADLATARRVPPGALAAALGGEEAHGRYVREYGSAVALLERRYGKPKVRLVLERLAPDDGRERWRDAAQDGVGRDAVLTMRAHLYRAAAQAGSDLLYIDL
jgi:hypothetical protein